MSQVGDHKCPRHSAPAITQNCITIHIPPTSLQSHHGLIAAHGTWYLRAVGTCVTTCTSRSTTAGLPASSLGSLLASSTALLMAAMFSSVVLVTCTSHTAVTGMAPTDRLETPPESALYVVAVRRESASEEEEAAEEGEASGRESED